MSIIVLTGFRKSKRLHHILLFLLLFLPALIFSLIQPIYGVSDEPAHTIKALATARLQFTGPEVEGQFGYDAMNFKVPNAYNDLWSFTCYSTDVNLLPTCDSPLSNDRTLVEVSSTAALYPPLYYLSVGWIGNIFVGDTGMYLMRCATALFVALLFTLAFVCLRRHLDVGTSAVATLLSYTPAVASFAGTVNPFSIEVGAAALFWCSSIAFFSDRCPNRKNLKTIYAFVTLSALMMALVRPVSFVWISIIAISLILFFCPKNVGGFLSWIKTKVQWLSVVAISFLVSVFYHLFFSSGTNFGASSAAGGDLWENLRISFERNDQYFLQLFGFFGWTHFYPPLVVPAIYCSVLLFVAARTVEKNLKQTTVIFFLIAFVMFGPTLLEGARAAASGFGYQGRYLLPVAVGIPFLLSVRTVVHSVDNQKQPHRSMIFAIAIANIIAMNTVIRRFTVGQNGDYLWFLEPLWTPPGGAILFIFLALFYLVTAMTMARAIKEDGRNF